MSETTRLKLFKHDNPASNTNLFNVSMALNENWDKIDEAQFVIIKHFNSIQEMKIDETLQEGDTCQTLGYYSANDGGAGLYKIVDDDSLTDDGGSIHDLNNGLKAQLIMQNNINVKQFGAYGDNSHDDSTAFNNAINYLQFIANKTLYIPNGVYLIDDTIVLTSYMKLVGEQKFLTKLKQGNETEMLRKPIITTDTTDDLQLTNVSIKNLSIESTGERTCFPIEIYNANGTTIENCLVQQNDNSSSYNHGILIDKTQNFVGLNFLTKIINSRFSKAKIKINSTDSYIENNEIWGNDLDCALHILNASTSIITNNQFVGGKVHGAIYVENSNEALKISNNYFDGSYQTINTQYAIKGTILHDSVITNNTFWKQKNGAIHLENSFNNTISNNTFQECDYYNNGSPDIFIGNNNQCFNNVISSNIFFRQSYYDSETSNEKERPTENPTAIIEIHNTQGYPASIIMNNVCSYAQYFGSLIGTGNIISRNNNSTKFYYLYNYKIDSIKNDKDVLFVDNNDPITNKIAVLVNGSLQRIDNIGVILNSSLSSNFDYNKTYNEENRIYINNVNNVSNRPNFVSANANPLIWYIPISGNSYALQIIFNYDSNNAGVKYRMLNNGTWGLWIG